MLILTRRVNEAVIIETDKGPMRVVVMKIKGRQVRLGFQGTSKVDREEAEVVPKEEATPQPGAV